jgi:hypothetical protein
MHQPLVTDATLTTRGEPMRDQLSRPLAAPHPTEAKLVPGYLLTPFGWAAQLLAGMVDAEPDLLAHVFELDRQRMHVIALALAHLDGNPPPQLGPVLLRGSARDLLHRVLGRSPVGIKRVLRRLPFAVLSQLSYRRLVQLLDDPQATQAAAPPARRRDHGFDDRRAVRGAGCGPLRS